MSRYVAKSSFIRVVFLFERRDPDLFPGRVRDPDLQAALSG